MSKHPTMTTRTAVDSATRTVTVTVTHGMRQSYSRAVRPLAFRVAAGAIGAEAASWTLADVDHDAEAQPAGPDRCATAYTFRGPRTHRPTEWGGCGRPTGADDVLTDPDEAAAVTCPDC